MRRIKTTRIASDSHSSLREPGNLRISERDYRLMRAVVRAAATIRKDRECTVVLVRALDAFNKPVKS